MSKLRMTFAVLASAAFLFLPANSQASGRGGGGAHGGGGSHGGGHGGHSGGGHYGGGHSGGSHYYGGHGGHYYGHGGGHWGGGHWGHGGHYGYWGSGWGWGWGWGFGPWWWGWGYPYGYYGYYGYPYGAGYYVGDGYGGGGYAGDPGERFAAVKTDVDPEEASLYLDGKLIGTADDFDGYPDKLYLGRGQYHLEFRLDGYEPLTTEIDASPGQFFRIDQHMKKIPGASHYGTYTPERPEGEINRYFEKNQPRYGSPNSDSNGHTPGYEARPPAMSEDRPVAPREAGDGNYDSATADFDDDRPSPAEPPAARETDSRIVFDVSPPDAAIYVDDRFMGSARELNGLGGGVAVPPGEHRITVTCPGYRDTTLRLETSAAKGGRAEVELKK